MTDEIMYELMQLSGQEYVDQYASKVKAAQGADSGFGSRERASVRELGDRVPGTRAS
jgi:1-acyl-sn-glycerol-3-phosphate acyltransferase